MTAELSVNGDLVQVEWRDDGCAGATHLSVSNAAKDIISTLCNFPLPIPRYTSYSYSHKTSFIFLVNFAVFVVAVTYSVCGDMTLAKEEDSVM